MTRHPPACLRRSLRSGPWVLATCLVGLPQLLPAQSTGDPGGDDRADAYARPSMQAVRLEPGEAIRLDGVLDEPAWDRVPPIQRFWQQDPREGAPPTEATEIRVVFDADALYIGAVFHESDPTGILAHQRQRDAGLGTDDRFMWILDTFLDGRTAYFFEINPAGLMGDGILRGGLGGGVNKSWDGIWEARTARGEWGWSAEVRIPFRTLNFDPARDTWGINFQRTVRRKNEEILWSGHRRNQGLFQPAHAGRITGLRDVSQGVGLEAKPYGTMGWRSTPGLETGDPTAFPRDIGIDLTYSITPNLRASATVNTDFAEVDVDRRRVNLTRFPLSFPEQRDFFLEGSGVFSFMSASGVNPYFSRRIGLVEGQPVPIQAGARMAGQAGPWDMGLLHVRTERHEGGPGEDFTAARIKRNIFAQSSVGAIYTRRNAVGVQDEDMAPPPEGHLAGADVDLFTSSFLGRRNLNLQAFYVVHTEPYADRDTPQSARRSRGIRLAYPNDIWRGHVSLREFGEAWDPQVGFAPRRGFRRVQPSLSFSPRPADHPWIRQVGFEVYFEYLTDLDSRLQTRRWELTFLELRFHSGDRFELEGSTTRERIDAPFEIHPGVVIPAGAYDFRQLEVSASTAGRRTLAGEVRVEAGEFWSGNRVQVSGELDVRPVPGVSLSTEVERNRVDLPEGTFSTTLFSATGGWHASPWTSLTGTLQYDDVSEVLGLYARFRHILRPGSDLYLVYTHNWRNEDGLRTLERGGTTKLTYTHRF